VFPVRYELNFYILFRRNSVCEGLICVTYILFKRLCSLLRSIGTDEGFHRLQYNAVYAAESQLTFQRNIIKVAE
jgi:hypothetical protein